MSSDPNDRTPPPSLPADSVEQPTNPDAVNPTDQQQASPDDSDSQDRPRRKILIGSQRDPAAYRPKPRRDWIPIVSKVARPKLDKKRSDPHGNDESAEASPAEVEEAPPAEEAPPPVVVAAPVETPPPEPVAPPAPIAVAPPPEPPVEPTVEPEPLPAPQAATPPSKPEPAKPVERPAPPKVEIPQEPDVDEDEEAMELIAPMSPPPPRRGERVPLPNLREELSDDLESEFLAAVGDIEIDDLISADKALADQTVLEPESKHTGRVVAVRRDDVFIELGGREQGVVPLRQFPQPPELGALFEVRVTRFNPEEGIYELALPHSAAEIGDWSQVEEGLVVEARVTGHNTGGLECEVSHLRGFIPVSQIALYRVEDLAQFVGEKFTCVITEANPERRNLVLSRRALLEREQEEAREQLWESLEPGQVREGVVRKLMDFGAFVDLGGVDGLVHVSQLGWGRVHHPSEVLQEGQRIQVRIQKLDPESKRISLSYRDMLQNPWDGVQYKYPVHSTVRGKVTKLMEFGAFVELEPGVEGLVHISELSHKRVWRVSDVVKEGDEVDVAVLSIDREAERISLSMKSLQVIEPVAADKDEEPELPPPPKKAPKKPTGPLRGGLGRGAGGDRFGLKW